MALQKGVADDDARPADGDDEEKLGEDIDAVAPWAGFEGGPSRADKDGGEGEENRDLEPG